MDIVLAAAAVVALVWVCWLSVHVVHTRKDIRQLRALRQQYDPWAINDHAPVAAIQHDFAASAQASHDRRAA